MTMASLEEALSLDLQVLKALLRRNHSSHGRTLYFQGISMAVRALERTLPSHPLNSLRHALEQYAKTRQEWTVDIDPIESVKKEFAIVKETLESGIPNVLSRIDYAAEALFVEVSRGFFLPLCIVAVACLARIRILIRRQACDCVMELQSLLRNYTNMKEIQTWVPEANFFETTLECFLEDPSNMQQARKPKFNVERTLQSLGLTAGKQKSGLMDVDNVEMDHEDSDDEIAEPQEDVIMKPSAAPGKLTRRDADDVGEHVSQITASLVSDIPLHKQSMYQRQDVSDKNSEFLRVKSSSAGGRKRKKEAGTSPSSSETRKNKKKVKKKAKKKKKKDIFDEIFGDV